jgi:hypothetical protein
VAVTSTNPITAAAKGKSESMEDNTPMRSLQAQMDFLGANKLEENEKKKNKRKK